MKITHPQQLGAIKRALMLVILAAITPVIGGAVQAGELGHYNPGVFNIRDFSVPEPGFYALLYNYYYTSDRLNDKNGGRVDSVTTKTGSTIGVDVNVDIYALVPVLMWVSPWEVLGARYAAYVVPSFSTSSVGAALSAVNGRGVSGDFDSNLGMGDLFVQPLWLGWPLKHWDFALGYGFYAPVGRYDVETIILPKIGSINVEAPDNIGLGFWTHQLQGAVTWYPWEHRGTAVAIAMTYELNQGKEDFDITPGSHVTLNWGISQYLPLTKDKKLMLDLGPMGYSQWKITDDTGSNARNGDVLDQVHAAGGQLGLAYVPWNAALNFHYLYEFASEARFQGQVFSIDFAVKF